MKKRRTRIIQGIFVLAVFVLVLLFNKDAKTGSIFGSQTFSNSRYTSPLQCPPLTTCTDNSHPSISPVLPSPTSTISSKLKSEVSYEKKVKDIAPPAGGYCLTVPVLLYHHVQPQSAAKKAGQEGGTVDNGWFDQQMAYLASHGYHTITVAELVNALRSHSVLPSKSLAVTLDDGYVDDYSYVLPTIKKYNITINLMIATGLVGNPDFISWDQLREMKGSGLVYFTDHTWSHYAVGRGPQDKVQYEITTGKQQLEQNIGQTVNIFTYPYGSFSPNAIQTLQQDGFIGAFSTIPGFLQCDSFIMTLHRNHVGNAPLSAYGL